MSEDALIAVQTFNSPTNLRELVSSLEHLSIDFSLLVVDDSSKRGMKEENREVVEGTPYDVQYVDDTRFERFKDRVESEVPEPVETRVLNELEIGQDYWDIPSGRNARQLLCHGASSADYYLFLDGDYRATPRTNVSTDRNDGLIAMEVEGSFDLSRVEWVFVCNRLVEIDDSYTGFESLDEQVTKMYGGPYIENIVSELSAAEVRADVGKYTNVLSTDGEIEDIQFPNRNYLSGGAFACTDDAVDVGYFPSWYGEDSTYFQQVAHELGIERPTTDTSFKHDPGEKDIFDRSAVERESLGMLLIVLTHKPIFEGSLTDSYIRELMESRIRRLERERERASRITSRMDLNDELNLPLDWEIDYLSDLQVDDVRAHLDRFGTRRAEWRGLLDSIEPGSVELETS